MKKLGFGIFFFFLVVNNILSQCRPVFVELQKQLPKPQGKFNYSFSENNNQYSTKYYNLHLVRSYGMSQDSQFLTCQYYDGNIWKILNEVFVKGWIYEMIFWGDRILLHGRFRGRVDQINLHKMYSLLEYKNGYWDTLPGAWNTSPYHRVFGTVGEDLYAAYVIEDSGSQQYWSIRKYDTTKKVFTPVANIKQKYTFPLFRTGKNKMLIAGISHLNGKSVKGYAYIENDSIYTNNDSRLDDSMFYIIDPVNDHVYAMKNTNEYSILEYSSTDAFISKRVAIDLQSRPSSPFYNVYGVYAGKIVLDDSDMKGNRFLSILCANEVKWKSIRTPYSMHSANGWSLPMVSSNGIFVYDQDTRTVLQLEEGSRIYGTVFIDKDSNCSYDSANEIKILGQQVKASSGKYLGVVKADLNGNYEVIVPAGSYNISGPAASPTCMTKVTIPVGVDIRKDVPIKPIQHSDLKISGLDETRVRWNSEIIFSIVIENIGRPLDSGRFEIKMDPRITIISADTQISSFSGNTASGVIKNIGYFDKSLISFRAIMDTSKAHPDSILCHEISVYPFDQDKDSTNNFKRICQLVAYSFDPNHKSCNREKIKPGKIELLEYTIEFQNEGNDDAYDVLLSDKLDSSLDLETFQVLAYSHPFSSISIKNHLLNVDFKSIYLKPKSVNEDSSKGYFKFSIATRNDLKKDQFILNKVQIYFDLNQPITTNTVYTTVFEENQTQIKAVTDIKSGAFLIYPNPTYNFLHIESQYLEKYTIYDSKGLIVTFGNLVEGSAVIDMSAWAPGIYFVWSNGAYSKIVKLAE